MSTAQHNHIRIWLIDLSKHVGRAQEVGDLAALIESTASMLAVKAPTELFTPDSLEFCLRRFKFFPSYAELWARLQTYQRERSNQRALAAPAVTSIAAAPADAPIPTSDRVHVDTWLRALDRGEADDAELASRLAVVRRVAPRGFDWLVVHNDHAGLIAHRQRWIADADPGSLQERMRAQWSDANVITKRVAALTSENNDQSWSMADWRSLRLLSGLVARWGPEHLHLIPTEESLSQPRGSAQRKADIRADDGVVQVNKPADTAPVESTPARQFYAKHGRPAGTLSAEALKATRMANPLLKPIAEQVEEKAVTEKLKASAPTAVFEPDDDRDFVNKPFPWNLLPDEDTAA